MKFKNKYLTKKIFVSLILLFSLCMALVFGTASKNLREQIENGTENVGGRTFICENVVAGSADGAEQKIQGGTVQKIQDGAVQKIQDGTDQKIQARMDQKIQECENQMEDILKRILEDGVFLFGADLPVDQSVSFDGKYIDWNMMLFGNNSYWEAVTDMDLSAQAPISDTENVTMQHTTYIINKNMKKFYHPGGSITDNKGEHELSDHLTKERGC